ncbi:uncharacterized protein LOC128553277 [Mercenaria mercenaria]|uniref:uncharacterized protein LOC128553277 n=1 Tax=Mercenaria mercenaria TaxID=6596 RepID=UPI00234F0AAE|nr:uncharacterized protein LOC128553277 [Mercenaria mercenaria]
MAIYSLIFRRGVSSQIRLQALLNAVCAIYIITMTVMVTHVSFFYIVPECYGHDGMMIFKHRLGIWYIFTAVVGNYLTCIFTETGTKPEVNVSQGGKVEERDRHVPANCKIVKRKVRCKDERQGQIRRKKSEKFCRTCNIAVSLRTHHCFLCEKCVIKRDHHCFFMGVCIGKSNHVYFILFTLFMGIGTFYGLLLIAKYLYFLYGIQFQGPQTFFSLFFNTIVTLLQGRIPSFRYLGLFLMLYVSLAGTLVSFGFLFWHVVIVTRGQTSYEARMGITKYSKGTYMANIQQVFSRYNIISLLVPFWDLAMDNISSG